MAGRAVGPHSNQFNLAVNPFDASGQMLPLLSPPDRTPVGEGDKKVQSYNFRLCVTKNATNMLPFPKPVGYDPATWELLRRYAKACFPDGSTEAQRGCQFGFPSCNTAPVPGGKYDMNNCGGMSSDFIGQSWNYPEANYTERQDIWRGHRDYQMGLLFTMANDPAMPAAVRNGMKPWGLCADEFAASQGWAPALYVRAARRLVGERIFNQNTPKELDAAGDIGEESIGLGNYNFDSHNAQRMACKSSADCMVSTLGSRSEWRLLLSLLFFLFTVASYSFSLLSAILTAWPLLFPSHNISVCFDASGPCHLVAFAITFRGSSGRTTGMGWSFCMGRRRRPDRAWRVPDSPLGYAAQARASLKPACRRRTFRQPHRHEHFAHGTSSKCEPGVANRSLLMPCPLLYTRVRG